MKRLVAGLSGGLAGLLPALACPACAPAYASLLSTAGISAIGSGPGYLIVILALLSISLASLCLDAWRYRMIGPLAVGLLGSAGIVLSKFVADLSLLNLIASMVLVFTAIWNALLVRRKQRTSKCGDRNACCGQKDEL